MTPYLRAANVKDGSLDLSDVKSMDFSPAEQSTYALRSGDVLVTEGAGSLAAVGASAVWKGEIEGVVCFQNTLLRLRPRGDTNARYLMWWVRHAYGSGLLASVAEGANIYHLGADNVRLLPASIPDPSAQRAIAYYLDTETARIDQVVSARSRQLGLCAEARRATLCEALPPAEGNVASRIKRVANLIAGGTPATEEPSYWGGDDDTPWVAISDMSGGGSVVSTQKRVTPAGQVAARLRVGEPGTVLLAMYASVGATALLGTAAVWNQAILGITPVRDLAEPRFLRYWLDRLADYWPTVVKSNTQDNLNAESVREAPFPSLPVVQQGIIADRLDEAFAALDRRTSLLTRQIDLLLERRQALITAAVTGQLDIPGVAA
ncbi:MAG: restriction endonuclease subunit S [Actinomycetota bacterium]|nr:restriction endonuclease subunit S [Actinomycetota bacterium]